MSRLYGINPWDVMELTPLELDQFKDDRIDGPTKQTTRQ